ncbi:Mv-ORF74 peptide [Maruca vitrata nucleopolyhedrovirus]|uniref:Mv-ORF74 peptide n=1 Tax=Maruca vitrata nucleopolyhedrovirus TaxID=1307954 RepID=A1YRD6_9ABAC|nr:Mv-ORF74 peptide [Maruca vitrata nucleopolyhedrovirus]ABL76026.1 Mv-ORF74 peptide [Maruca vitrata nucleopolyhedrovirus]
MENHPIMGKLGKHQRDILMATIIHRDEDDMFLKKIQESNPVELAEWRRLEKMGIHGMVAGGFAAYTMGLTTCYSDVDFYTRFCEVSLKTLIESGDYEHNYVCICGRSYVINHKYSKIQIIFMQKGESKANDDLSFYYEILKSFDMVLCSKGFILEEAGNHTERLKYINVNYDSERPSFKRAIKYQNRFKHFGVPSTLQELCQSKILKLDPNYKKLYFIIPHYCG